MRNPTLVRCGYFNAITYEWVDSGNVFISNGLHKCKNNLTSDT